MPTELVQVIKEAADYARRFEHWEMTPHQVGHLKKLGVRAKILAARTPAVLMCFPQVESLAPEVTVPGGQDRPVQYVSEFHLPGDWDRPSQATTHSVNRELAIENGLIVTGPEPDRVFVPAVSPGWLEAMDILLEIAKSHEHAIPANPTDTAKSDDPVPEWIGDNRYRIGGEVVSLEEAEANVLQALIENGGTATKPELANHAGVSDPGKILSRLRKKYPGLRPHLTMPRGRGRGGYRTAIRDARPTPDDMPEVSPE